MDYFMKMDMKNILKPLSIAALVGIFQLAAEDVKGQAVSINATGTAPDAQSILDVSSTTKGVLLPRMTSAERVAVSPSAGSDFGMMVYDTDTKSYWYWDGSTNSWMEIPNSGNLPSASDYIVNGTSQQTSADFNIDGDGTLSDLYLTGSDIFSTGILRIGSTTDVRVRLDTDGNGSQQFQVTNDGGSTPVFSVTESGNMVATGTGEFNGDLTLVGASRTLVAGTSFDITGTSGIDIIIDSDNNSSVAAFRIQKDAGTDLFEIQEDGDVFFSDLVGAGTSFLQTDAAGQVTRSTADPSTIISGSGTATQVAYFDAAQNITSEAALYWDATNDRLGVGTSSPDRTLNVGGATGAQILLTREDNTTMAGDVLGELLFDSTDDTTPSTTDASAGIRAYASEDQGNSNKGGYLTFFTKPTGTLGTNPATERLRITQTGNVGIGDQTPTARLNVDAASGDLLLVAQGGTQRLLVDGNGNTTISGKFNSNGIQETSDIRFKTNITDLSNSLEKLMQLRGVTYNWKVNEFPERTFNNRTEIGVIAQEVEKIFPELVNTDEDGYKSVQYSHMVPLLLEAIKEQQKMIESLSTTVDVLRSDYAGLKSLLEMQLESAEK